MNTKIGREIIKSPFPAIAAEVRWGWEEYTRGGGLPERLGQMVKAGIMSEVLDLIEALEVPEVEARDLLAATYERAAAGAIQSSTSEFRKGTDLAVSDRVFAEECRVHAYGLREGSVDVGQELAARAEAREAVGHPDNFYTSLLANPVFPSHEPTNFTIEP